MHASEPMKVLVQLHTFNDEEVIDRSLAALLNQTYRVPEILVVDNASTDGTLKRTFPDHVTIIRHPKNLGTSGTVATGFQYAIRHGYDLIWVLDADSIVCEDALEKLVTLYQSFPVDVRRGIGVLSSRIVRSPNQPPDDYGLLTPRGPRPAKVDPRQIYYECDSTIWSGSLFSLSAVREVGSPRFGTAGCWDDLSLDWGDIEFIYRIRRAGYRVLVHRHSIIRHALGWQRKTTLLGRTIYSTNHSAFRRYLYFRNGVYFWFYLYPRRRPTFIAFHLGASLMSQIAKILLMEDDRWSKISASLRGVRDGLRHRIHDMGMTE